MHREELITTLNLEDSTWSSRRQAMLWIRAEGLSKFYGSFTAIEDVSFEVSRGSITAFLGPNGAGKSTTLRCLTGYLAPSAGRSVILGHDMATDRLAGSREVGYLGESGALYPDMTPASYLRFAGTARGMGAAEVKQALERVAVLCQLKEVWSKPIRKLSRGFRQRVGTRTSTHSRPKSLDSGRTDARPGSESDCCRAGPHQKHIEGKSDFALDPYLAGSGGDGRHGDSD